MPSTIPRSHSVIVRFFFAANNQEYPFYASPATPANYFPHASLGLHTRGIGKAFDLSTEDPGTIARYDTRHLFDEKKLQRWNDMRRATNKLGLQMLMARKRCEAGCGFVTAADCGWDYHTNNTLFDLNPLRVTGGPPGEIINLSNRAEPIPELFG